LNKEFRENTVKARSLDLHDRLEQAFASAVPAGRGMERRLGHDQWYDDFVHMKEEMMLSPMNYRIHYAPPGTPFDPAWMQVEDDGGSVVHLHHCEGKKVKLCLQPALVERQVDSLSSDAPIADALIKNKRFIPSPEEKKSFKPVDYHTVMIAKASCFRKD
jgi:hypothetical protein